MFCQSSKWERCAASGGRQPQKFTRYKSNKNQSRIKIWLEVSGMQRFGNARRNQLANDIIHGGWTEQKQAHGNGSAGPLELRHTILFFHAFIVLAVHPPQPAGHPSTWMVLNRVLEQYKPNNQQPDTQPTKQPNNQTANQTNQTNKPIQANKSNHENKPNQFNKTRKRFHRIKQN